MIEARRLLATDVSIGVEAIRRLKAPDGYPVPAADSLKRFLRNPDNVLIAAFEHGVPVGYVVAYVLDRVDRDARMMFFYEIGVAESHRRRGIGTRMIGELKRICREEDVMKMWVPTARSNIAATRLYASTGAVAVPSEDDVTYLYSRESFD